jgi:hypothetical protein
MRKRYPTTQEYVNYDGAHCRNLWRSLNDTWRCPGCGRSKFEIMRWTKKYFRQGVGKCRAYDGWMAGLHRHHDHAAPYLSGRGRFPDTIICDQCNSVDGPVKRRLDLPDNFSFSPSEILKFVESRPHERHRINFDEASRVYDELTNQSHRMPGPLAPTSQSSTAP